LYRLRVHSDGQESVYACIVCMLTPQHPHFVVKLSDYLVTNRLN